MKYFENLPKKTFSSSIGDFTISDFFTYIDIDSVSLQADEINVDAKTTLLEAAYQTYEDPNSFWTFLIANAKINPFDLLEPNTTIFKEKNEPKIDFILYANQAGTTGIAFPQGSIVVPYTSNTGSSASWSSVGNFDLNGPLALIEQSHFYDGTMTVKTQKGSTATFINANGLTGDVFNVIYPTGTGYTISKLNYSGTKTKYLSKIVEIKKPEDGRVILKDTKSSYPTLDEEKGQPIPVVPTETKEISVIQATETKSKKIKAYPATELGFLQSRFISVKYN